MVPKPRFGSHGTFRGTDKNIAKLPPTVKTFVAVDVSPDS